MSSIRIFLADFLAIFSSLVLQLETSLYCISTHVLAVTLRYKTKDVTKLTSVGVGGYYRIGKLMYRFTLISYFPSWLNHLRAIYLLHRCEIGWQMFFDRNWVSSSISTALVLFFSRSTSATLASILCLITVCTWLRIILLKIRPSRASFASSLTFRSGIHQGIVAMMWH